METFRSCVLRTVCSRQRVEKENILPNILFFLFFWEEEIWNNQWTL